MYGDTLVMRRRAGQLREQGAEIRATADRLVARSEAIPWRGRAADAMRSRVKERAAHLRAAANSHDTAATSLERHVSEVDQIKDTISQLERKAASRVEEARSHLASSAYDESAATDDDRRLADLALPPSGHADWLTLELHGS